MSSPTAGTVPPATTDAAPLLLWMHLPPANRRRLLWLLSQLLERQIAVAGDGRSEAGRDDPTSRR